MKRSFFITATGTGCGKTLATAALLRAAQERGHHAIVAKPVETGARDGAHDVQWSLSFSLLPYTDREQAALTLYRFPLPASPHLAAREAGATIDVSTILAALDIFATRWDTVIIEGAGGLLVPLNDRETVADLIEATEAEPVLVVGNQLGAINHTALTLNEMRRRGIDPNLIVVNMPGQANHPDDALIRTENVRMIRTLASPAPVIEQPFVSTLDAKAVAALGHRMADALRL